MKPIRSLDVFAYFLISLFWGGSFIAIKEVISVVSPILAGSLRILAAVIFLLVFNLIKKKKFYIPKDKRLLVWTAGVLSAGLPFSLLFWGERLISPGLAGIINGTALLWVFIWSLVFKINPEMTFQKAIGLVLGISGICIIFEPRVTGGQTSSEIWGILAISGMSCSYGIGTIVNRKVLADKNVDFFGSLFHQLSAAFIFSFVLALIFEHPLSDFTKVFQMRALVATLYMGWCSTGIAFIIYFHLIREWGAVRAATSAYLVPAFALVLDFIINHNSPRLYEIVGGMVVLVGVILIQIPIRRRQNV